MFESYDYTRMGVSCQQSLANYLRDHGAITTAEYADPVDPTMRTRIIPLPQHVGTVGRHHL